MRRASPSAWRPPVAPSPAHPESETAVGPGRADIEHGLVSGAQAYLAVRGAGRAEPDLAAAWEDFFLAIEPTVHALARGARRAGLDPADAEQEAWAAIVARLPDYRPDPARGPFRAWAVVVIRHSLANLARRWPHRMPANPRRDEALLADPAEAIERAERRARLRRGLLAFRAEAGATSLRVVLLHWGSGLTADEIAARLGLTEGQVRGRLARAKPRLRACLGREFDPD